MFAALDPAAYGFTPSMFGSSASTANTCAVGWAAGPPVGRMFGYLGPCGWVVDGSGELWDVELGRAVLLPVVPPGGALLLLSCWACWETRSAARLALRVLK